MNDTSKKVKIHIAFKTKDCATGGGNQFLKSLKKYFRSIKAYEEDVKLANVVLFNSHQHTCQIAKMKTKYPHKPFVHRIDGPMKLYNRPADRRDRIVYLANRYLAEATVFQSAWSRQKNFDLGLPKNMFETVICNAPDAAIFNRDKGSEFSTERKTRLIATSWSKNWSKGFEVYQWLDEHLDFNRFEMVFLGNSPVEFKNITHIPPLNSKAVAAKLKESDIFITASQKDPCSNSLIEALHCGLPAIGLRDGGHPNIIGRGGETFDKPEDIPAILEKVKNNYYEYQNRLAVPAIDEIGKEYYDFIRQLHDRIKTGRQKIKPFSFKDYLLLRVGIYYSKICGKAIRLFERS